MKQFIIDKIESHPSSTQTELKDAVLGQFGINLSHSTISRTLQGALITLKNIRFVPNTANSQVNKLKRKSFVETLLNYTALQHPIVYIDETNFNMFISRSQAWSATGQRVNVTRPSSRGKNIHLIGAIGTNGFTYFESRRD